MSVPERLHTGHDLRSWLHRHRRPEPWHGPPRLDPHLGADLRRSLCGGLRCRASGKAPAAGCHAALCHHQIVGLMLAGMRKKHAKYTPLRFHGCGPSLLKPKRTPQALPAGFRSVVILRTCVAQGQIADGGSGCGREVRPTGHHAPGVDGPGEDALQHGLELLVAADRQRTAVAGHEVDVVARSRGRR